jgi:ribonuclease E
MPKFVDRLKLYDEKAPLFHKYGIEDEIAKIQRRHVPLRDGGSIVIDQTEALVAIDVNSGNFRFENDAERTAYEMNLRAAKEIARQLRLRDLGGVIVNDFIDMRDERHRRGVEKALRDAIKRDRARSKVLSMSAFGLIEMTRQRIRPSLKRSVYEDCPHCSGRGGRQDRSRACPSTSCGSWPSPRTAPTSVRVNVGVCGAVATFLNNRNRREIARPRRPRADLTIHIRPEDDAPAEHLQIECFDGKHSEVRLLPAPARFTPPGSMSRRKGVPVPTRI